MAQVISATIRRAQRGNSGYAQRQHFLAQALLLLNESRALAAEGKYDLALEKAYQSGLRTAGAAMATSSVIAKRKRLPSSAWDRLELVGSAEKEWASSFRAHSRTRSRVLSGMLRDVSSAVVYEVMDLAAQFLMSVESGDQFIADAA
ncbi:MAG: SAV_6107 family HEPN domain-containing protein [Corynebacterium sp.]|nr:SAV_6107 family HEPN domain-containing protein [Corynebacterium sp.]